MHEYLLEPFLTQYFLLESICENYMTEKELKKMFFDLANIFCLSDVNLLTEYYNDTKLEHFASVKSVSSYERLCRSIEFSQNAGHSVMLTERDKMLLAQKRAAMNVKAKLFTQDKNVTKDLISSSLLTNATNGSIDAMAVLSYLEYNGICMCKDTESAIKRNRLCAKWNNLFGNLMGIAYDKDKELYYEILHTVFRNANQRKVYDYICKYNNHKPSVEKNRVASLIENAFALGIIKREKYDRMFAKVAFSKVVSIEDKEKLLLNKQADAIGSMSDIPFDMAVNKRITVNKKCTDNLPIKREQEIKKILQNITIAESCPMEAYVPLLVVASDEYIAEMYGDMIKSALVGSDIVELDASLLNSHDFAPIRENVFIRSLSETKNASTVFILSNCDTLNEEQVTELQKMLDYNYRRKFKLYNPAVSVNLSGAIILLFASELNSTVNRLAEDCDVVPAARINKTEKTAMVNFVFKCRLEAFGESGITLDKACVEYLAEYEPKKVKQIIDSALRNAIFDKKTVLTLETIKEICADRNIAVKRRGFGYMGGKLDA